MKKFRVTDEATPALKRSSQAKTKLRRELPTDIEMETIPLKELLSLARYFHAKTREASQKINKTFQTIQCDFRNNTTFFIL